jgi:hypothetical protein
LCQKREDNSVWMSFGFFHRIAVGWKVESLSDGMFIVADARRLQSVEDLLPRLKPLCNDSLGGPMSEEMAKEKFLGIPCEPCNLL